MDAGTTADEQKSGGPVTSPAAGDGTTGTGSGSTGGGNAPGEDDGRDLGAQMAWHGPATDSAQEKTAQQGLDVVADGLALPVTMAGPMGAGAGRPTGTNEASNGALSMHEAYPAAEKGYAGAMELGKHFPAPRDAPTAPGQTEETEPAGTSLWDAGRAEVEAINIGPGGNVPGVIGGGPAEWKPELFAEMEAERQVQRAPGLPPQPPLAKAPRCSG